MKDYMVRALAFNDQVRVYAVSTTQAVGEAQRRHYTWPTASAALGRTMTIGVLMGAMLKDEDKLTIKIEGGGPIGAIIVDANAAGGVRGYVSNPQTHFELNAIGKLDVARAVGVDGLLTVSKDIGLKQAFVGQVPLVSGEIGDDFTSYMVYSEQIASSVGAGVIVNPDNTIQAAGGFIIQVLPDTDMSIIEKIEQRLATIPSISALVQQGLTPEEILEQILGTGEAKILDRLPVHFSCDCSKEKVLQAVTSLGTAEMTDMLQSDKRAQAQCHFCNEVYEVDAGELEQLIAANPL